MASDDELVSELRQAKLRSHLPAETRAMAGDAADRLQALGLDARRYRWLRDNTRPDDLCVHAWAKCPASCAFGDPDAAIDAALTPQK